MVQESLKIAQSR
jgi:hypothetical protein